MPLFKGVSVLVTDTAGLPFIEYGAQKLRGKDVVSCYVQSETDKQFQLALKVNKGMLYDSTYAREDYRTLEDGSVWKRVRGCGQAQGEFRFEDDGSVWMKVMEFVPDGIEQEQEETSRGADLGGDVAVEDEEVPWHLVAVLHLDGRESHERRVIIYLDRAHQHYEREKKLNYGLHVNAEGHIIEAPWKFSEVGIEFVLDSMLSLGDDRGVPEPAQEEQELADAFGGLGKDGMEDAEEQSRVGQIEVKLDRIVLGEIDPYASLTGYANEIDSEPAGQNLAGVSHTITREGGVVKPKRGAIQKYDLIDPEEERPYATFKFYYKNEADLRKRFGNQVPTTAGPSRLGTNKESLERAAASPLSISLKRDAKTTEGGEKKVKSSPLADE